MGRKPTSEQDPLILAQAAQAARTIEAELTARSLSYTDVDKAVRGGNAFHAGFLGDGTGLPRIKSALWPKLARALTLDLAVIGGKEWAKMQPVIDCGGVTVLPTVRSKALTFSDTTSTTTTANASPAPAKTSPVAPARVPTAQPAPVLPSRADSGGGHILPERTAARIDHIPKHLTAAPFPSDADPHAQAEWLLTDALRRLKALPRVDHKAEQLDAAQRLNESLGSEVLTLRASVSDRDAKIKVQAKEIEALRAEVESYRQAARAFMGSIPPATAKLLANA